MIFLINFLNKKAWFLYLALFLPAGCVPQIQDKPEPLALAGLEVVEHGPQAARLGSLRCSLNTSGGSGEMTFAFRTLKAGIETVEYSGKESTWRWSPKEPGLYQVKATVTDGAGVTVDSGWSKEYRFEPPVGRGSLYAVLPVDNISGVKAPLKAIQQALIKSLSEKGFRILAQDVLEDFMAKNRMRYTGGLSSEIGRKLQAEHGVDGVFITSLETWQDGGPPRISLITRVDLSGAWPEILWIDSVGLTGNDAPGLLGLGRINRAEQLLAKAMESLLGSFQLYLEGGYPTHRFASDRREMKPVNSAHRIADFSGARKEGKSLPAFTYRATDFDPAGFYTVAVAPFLNVDVRKNAGDVVALHFIKQLSRYENLRVVEPGLVRQLLLDYRIIMEEGPSLASSDILTSKKQLGFGVNLVLFGKVFDYQEGPGMSKVDFSVQVFDGDKREIIWTSRSYGAGNDGVYFFDLGSTPSAHGLTSGMTKVVVEMLEE